MDREGGTAGAAWRFPLVVGLVLLVVFGAAHLVNRDVFETSTSDYGTYYRPVAEQIADGDGIVTSAGEPGIRYPPGYPVVLAAAIALGRVIGIGTATAALVANLFTTVGCGALLAAVARSLFGRPVAIASVAIWATYPLNVYVFTQPGSDPLFILLLLAAVGVLLPVLDGRPASWRVLAGAGALLGLASLVRPIGPAALVAVAVAIAVRSDLSRRVRLQQFATTVAALVLVVAPWTIWASSQAHELTPLSTGGPPSVADGLKLGAGDAATAGRVPMPAASREITDAAAAAPLRTGGDIARFVGDQAQERPFGLAGLLGVKAVRSWYGTESVRHEGLLALLQAAYLVVIAAGLWQVSRTRGSTGRRFAAFSLALLASFWAVTTLVLPLFWYVMPAINVALIAAGAVPLAVAARIRPPVRSSG